MITSKGSLTADDIDAEVRYKLSSSTIDFNDVKLVGPKQAVNLLSSKMLRSSQLSHRGWFNDHSRWMETVHCFNSRWSLCDKVYSTKCRQNGIQGIYQYVPFKSSKRIRGIFFSLRASAELLIEQSNDAFYGLVALIETIDGAKEIVRLKFQYESEPWPLRTLNYRSKGVIFSVTIMLACYGYSGEVSFSDVRLTTESADSDPIFSWKEITSYCARDEARLKYISSKSQQTKSVDYESIDLWSVVAAAKSRQSSPSPSVSTLTLVTQISMDRLIVLERSLATWIGPVSIAIYVPIKNTSSELEDWHRLYIHKKVASLHLPVAYLNVSSILIVPYPETLEYPINQLRNLAMDKVKTPWMFLIDGDFQSSPDLANNFANFLQKYHSNLLEDGNNTHHQLYAFVVPAFEYLEMPNKDDPVIKSKDELIELVHREDQQLLQPLRQSESIESQSLTDYYRWYYTNVAYNLTTTFHDKYEPYVIVKRLKELPRYREQLTNHGMNKVVHATQMFAAGYRFQVLPDVWTIHFPHRTAQYYQTLAQNVERRLENIVLRFEVIEEIIWKYGWQPSDDCPMIESDDDCR